MFLFYNDSAIITSHVMSNHFVTAASSRHRGEGLKGRHSELSNLTQVIYFMTTVKITLHNSLKTP